MLRINLKFAHFFCFPLAGLFSVLEVVAAGQQGGQFNAVAIIFVDKQIVLWCVQHVTIKISATELSAWKILERH